MTWAEFIEAGLVREYRQGHRIPMIELRAFIDSARREFGEPYPLAHRAPYMSGRSLLYQAQVSSGLTAEWALVAAVDQQMVLNGVVQELVLTAPSQSFIDRVDWSDDIAAQWRPTADPKSVNDG